MGVTDGVNVVKGGERGTYDLFSYIHNVLDCLAEGCGADIVIQRDAADQDALKGASVKGAYDEGWGSSSSQFTEEVETLLSLLGQRCSVLGPGEVMCAHQGTLVPTGTKYSALSSTVYGQRAMFCVLS